MEDNAWSSTRVRTTPRLTYAISLKPDALVLLHLNCMGNKWRTGESQGIIMHNKKCGRALAAALCNRLNHEIFCPPSGNRLGSRPCKPMMREKRELGGAGWLNATDAEGIPAVVVEAFYVDNRSHVDFLSHESNAQKAAKVLAIGIIDFFRSRTEGKR